MGGEHSKIQSGGRLEGAYLPSTTSTGNLDLGPKERIFSITAPAKKGQKTVRVRIDGELIILKVPRGVKPNESFDYRYISCDISKVIASTLPTAPGHEIVQAKPIVFASVSFSFSSDSQQSMGLEVQSLLQDAQKQILREVVKAQCNACLGMTFNVTNDSSGNRGMYKMVIVTVCGTPCVVLPTSREPAVMAEVVVEPLYYG